jgi:phosphotransferase system enzyme I (PtsP)
MFPMVAEVAEFINARAAVLEERAFLERQGHPSPRSLMVGAMIEVPSLLFQLDAFLAEVDFVSIGSNDLMQFLFASDRGHPKLAGRYDPLSPPGLNALRFVAERARAFDVPVNLCGEMAGRPLEAMALIGLGYRSISMAPAAIGPVKSMTLMLDASKLESFLMPLLGRGDHSIRAELMGFAADNNIPV